MFLSSHILQSENWEWNLEGLICQDAANFLRSEFVQLSRHTSVFPPAYSGTINLKWNGT